MKSLPALILLLATALTQALGVYRYSNDAITMSGQVFFPILFALTTAYIGIKAPRTTRFSTAYYAIAGIAALLLVLTLVGVYTDMYWFHPTTTLYYIALSLLVIVAALAIASVPKVPADVRPQPVRYSKRKTPRSTNLVAVAKSPAVPVTRERPLAETEPPEVKNV